MSSSTFEPQILPAQGTYSAALSTNLQPGDQYDSGVDLDGNGQDELDVATLSQTFDTLAGTLTFKYNFLTADGDSLPDDVFWVKLDGVLVVQGSAPNGATPRSSWPDASRTGGWYNGSNLGSANGQTGWLTYSTSVTEGTHSLEFGVGEHGDHAGPSILLVDDVNVPSPYVSVSPTSVTVSENGATRTSTISLQQPPNYGVIVNLTADDPTQYKVNGADSASVILSGGHMSEVVTISAVNDNVDEPNPHTGKVTTSNTESSDEDFDDLPVDDINVTVRDNDDPPVVTADGFVFNGGVLDNYEVARFTDTNPSETHTATISWDDGPDTAGTVTTTVGSETVDGRVRGSHTYGVSGVYNASVTVTDHGNPPERSGSDTLNINATNVPLPVATAATGTSQTGFTANWDVSPAILGYRFDAATTNAFGATILPGYNDLDLAGTSQGVVGLTPGDTYYYRVRVYNAKYTSANSNVISASTIPPDPVAVAATLVGSYQFTANWNPSHGSTSYRLDVATDGGFGAGTLVAGFADKDVGAGTSALVDGLEPASTYYYRLRAVNSAGTSGSSNTISVLTTPAPPVATAATGMTTTTFTANWNASTGADSYRLDVATDGGFGGGTLVAGFADKDVGSGTSALVDGLSAGTTYYYRVRAANASGASGDSNTVSVITVPPAPVATAATGISATSFTANWTASAGADSYRLDVATDGGFGGGTLVAGFADKDVGPGTSALVDGLAPNSSYHYRVRTRNENGASGDSNTVDVLTTPCSPVATEATAVTMFSFTANWTTSAGAASYRLDVARDMGFSELLPGYADRDVGAATSAGVGGLSFGTCYYYRVRALNGSGPSPCSNVIEAQTSEPIPAVHLAGLLFLTALVALLGLIALRGRA